ncbi:MAG: phosphoadenylyl-sulfate reductase [Bryobacteraceae bacterium]
MGPYSRFENVAASHLVRWAIETHQERFAIATSFQKGGMVLLDLAWRTGLPFRAFTLDTGRLPEETHSMIEDVRQRYGIAVEIVKPDPAEVRDMVQAHGPDLFYCSPGLRQMCCNVRKVRPFERKLQEFDAWATGLRRGQGATRAAVPKVAEEAGRLKLAPLADWSAEQVDAYLRRYDVPVHPLYEQGYTSIGCAPCTRAILEGEDERAGRWWWEVDTKKECGIHFAADGSSRAAS